jgi:energy-coupling factor transporter ATP-binding protein EcfA2
MSELEYLVSKRPILIPGFVGLLTREEFRTPARRNQIITEGRHTEVLRNVLLQIKNEHPDRFSALNSIIERYFGVYLSNLSFSQENDQFITADYKQASADLDLVSGGSGFLQILQLLTFFYFVNPDIVLLDEPDAHLHSSLQKVLLELLQEISREQGIQFIIATHSKELINNADPEMIVTISSGEDRAQRLSSYTSVLETLKGIGAVDNVDVALLVKNKKCLFVEDSTQAETLKRISRLLNKKLFEGDSQLVVVVRGGASVTRYYDDLPMLRQFLGTQIKSLSVMDGDYATDDMKQEIAKESESKGVALHILRKSEIENYLLNINLMSRVATVRSKARGGPEITPAELNSILEQALDDTKLAMTDQIAQQFSNWHRWKGDPISLSTANEKARAYAEGKWSTIDDKMTICQGKEVLAHINSVLQPRHHVSLSIAALLAELTISEVDTELKELTNKIEGLWNS